MVEGSCLRGAVRFKAKAMSGIFACHRSMCRKASGRHAGFFLVAPRKAVPSHGAHSPTSARRSPPSSSPPLSCTQAKR